VNFIKPKKLGRGSTIAVVSPSWGGPSRFPHVFEKGLSVLRDTFGFNTVEYPTARMDEEALSGNPELRANDINDAFGDDSVDAIIASIGGDDSIRILRYLDIPHILRHPKIIMGYSDTVTLLAHLNRKGLVTFHGPAVMAGWAQLANFGYLPAYYENILTANHAELEWKPFPTWSEAYPDWTHEGNAGGVLNLHDNLEGFVWLQGGKVATGKIWGGCYEVLEFLNGTEFWPEKDFWTDKILMIETSEEKPAPVSVGRFLRNLGIQGILDRISGILIGRPRDYTGTEKRELYNIAVDVVAKEFGRHDLVMVANLDFGHTEPNLVIPFGIETEIDPVRRTIRHVEKIFQD
jgi:muramoyltetrapeptide carboxypeptidase LdcA involved in peptidoglycan recycling